MSKHQMLNVKIKKYINKDMKVKKLSLHKICLPFFVINRKGVTLPESLGLQEELVPWKELEEVPRCQTKNPMQEGAAS